MIALLRLTIVAALVVLEVAIAVWLRNAGVPWWAALPILAVTAVPIAASAAGTAMIGAATAGRGIGR